MRRDCLGILYDAVRVGSRESQTQSEETRSVLCTAMVLPLCHDNLLSDATIPQPHSLIYWSKKPGLLYSQHLPVKLFCAAAAS